MKVLAFLCVLISGSVALPTTVELLSGDSASRFTTLVSLVQQAGLVDTLNGGTFTIFAPTDDAFKKVPAATITALQNNVTALTDLLTYHVIGSAIMSSAVKDEMKLTMVNQADARLNVYTHNNAVTIQGANISQFDLTASNGVVHVLDSVMMPPSKDIVAVVAARRHLSTLLSLVQQAGLASALQADALTLFAPTDAAFAKLSADQLKAVQNDPILLASILKYHVVASTEYSAGLYQRETLDTLEGQDLTVHFVHHGKAVKINNALVQHADIGTTNGVVHIIDHVLMPPTSGPAVGR